MVPLTLYGHLGCIEQEVEVVDPCEKGTLAPGARGALAASIVVLVFVVSVVLVVVSDGHTAHR